MSLVLSVPWRNLYYWAVRRSQVRAKYESDRHSVSRGVIILAFDTSVRVMILRVQNHLLHSYRTIFLDPGDVKAIIKICKMSKIALYAL